MAQLPEAVAPTLQLQRLRSHLAASIDGRIAGALDEVISQTWKSIALELNVLQALTAAAKAASAAAPKLSTPTRCGQFKSVGSSKRDQLAHVAHVSGAAVPILPAAENAVARHPSAMEYESAELPSLQSRSTPPGSSAAVASPVSPRHCVIESDGGDSGDEEDEEILPWIPAPASSEEGGVGSADAQQQQQQQEAGAGEAQPPRREAPASSGGSALPIPHLLLSRLGSGRITGPNPPSSIAGLLSPNASSSAPTRGRSSSGGAPVPSAASVQAGHLKRPLEDPSMQGNNGPLDHANNSGAPQPKRGARAAATPPAPSSCDPRDVGGDGAAFFPHPAPRSAPRSATAATAAAAAATTKGALLSSRPSFQTPNLRPSSSLEWAGDEEREGVEGTAGSAREAALAAPHSVALSRREAANQKKRPGRTLHVTFGVAASAVKPAAKGVVGGGAGLPSSAIPPTIPAAAAAAQGSAPSSSISDSGGGKNKNSDNSSWPSSASSPTSSSSSSSPAVTPLQLQHAQAQGGGSTLPPPTQPSAGLRRYGGQSQRRKPLSSAGERVLRDMAHSKERIYRMMFSE